MSPELQTVTAQDLPFYLLERGLLDRDSIVDGDLRVADLSRRNRNFKVLRRRGPSYFVKQARDTHGDTDASLRREATCYELAAKVESLAPLRALLPTYHGYDEERHLLVLGLEEGERSVAHDLGWVGPEPELAAAAGRALGRFHSAAADLGTALPEGAFPSRPPWVLSIHRTPEGFMPVTGEGQRALLAAVRADARLHRALDGVASGWRREHLIHGDVKWDNLLIVAREGAPQVAPEPAPQSAPPSAPQCRWIDWELADLGDPAWDLGALVQSFVCLYMPHASTPTANQVWQHARRSVGALVTAYGEERGWSRERLGEMLPHAVALGGARAVQSAFEMLYLAPQVTPLSQSVVQTAVGMMEDPATWTGALFS